MLPYLADCLFVALDEYVVHCFYGLARPAYAPMFKPGYVFPEVPSLLRVIHGFVDELSDSDPDGWVLYVQPDRPVCFRLAAILEECGSC